MQLGFNFRVSGDDAHFINFKGIPSWIALVPQNENIYIFHEKELKLTQQSHITFQVDKNN